MADSCVVDGSLIVLPNRNRQVSGHATKGTFGQQLPFTTCGKQPSERLLRSRSCRIANSCSSANPAVESDSEERPILISQHT